MDLLHGITMADGGVSQRISVELADAQEEGRRQQQAEADKDEEQPAEAAAVTADG
jgi:hypothetical protein